jgi:hypothetical protein
MLHIPYRVDNQIAFLFRFWIEFLADFLEGFSGDCRSVGDSLLSSLLRGLLAAALGILRPLVCRIRRQHRSGGINGSRECDGRGYQIVHFHFRSPFIPLVSKSSHKLNFILNANFAIDTAIIKINK